MHVCTMYIVDVTHIYSSSYSQIPDALLYGIEEWNL